MQTETTEDLNGPTIMIGRNIRQNVTLDKRIPYNMHSVGGGCDLGTGAAERATSHPRSGQQRVPGCDECPGAAGRSYCDQGQWLQA